MYRIINTKDGAEIGSTETPRYITLSDNGSLIEVPQEEAQGVAFKGTAYNLLNTQGVGAEDTVLLSEYDAGDNAAETIKNTASIAELETAICDLDEQINGGE